MEIALVNGSQSVLDRQINSARTKIYPSTLFCLPSRQQPRSRRQLANRPKIEREAYLLHPGRSYGRLLNNLG